MNIECPDCSASYNIDESRIPSDGMSMRCPKCSHSFKVTTTGVVADVGGGTLMAGLGASQKRLYIKRPSGKVFGPFERNSIRTMLSANKLSKEALFSPDKLEWQKLDTFPEFSDFEMPDGQDPKVTHMGGWPSTDAPKDIQELPVLKAKAPKLPTPRLPIPKLPSDLPAKLEDNLPKKAGLPSLPGLPDLPELPQKMNGFPDLPGVASELPGSRSELPAPASGLPVSMPSLPGVKGDSLPALAGSLPQLFGQELPASFVDNIELPAVPGSVGRTLNSGLLPLSDDDDLFGRDDDDDDLFKPESSVALDLSSEVSLFGREDSDSDDLFARSESEEDVLQIQRNDDFLSDGDNFSFLEEEAGDEKSDGWGEDLFSEKSESQQFENEGHESDAFDDWGDDLLSEERHSSSLAEKSFSEPPPVDDPMRPKSRGIHSSQVAAVSAVASKESSKDDDKKRGMLSFVAVFAAVVILGGVGWVVYTQFFEDTNVAIKPVVKKKLQKIDVALDTIKSDNFDALSKVTEAAHSTKVNPNKRGELLLTQSLFLSRYEDPKTFESAKKLSSVLDGAATDFEKLGRGAFDAVQGNEAAARTYVSDLSGNDGMIGFYANALIGIANIKSIENEMGKPVDPIEKKEVPEEEKEIENKDEENKDEKEGVEKNDKKAEEGNSTTGVPVIEPPKEDKFAARKDRAVQALKVATKLDKSSPLPGYWLGRLHELMKEPKQAKKAYDRKSNATHVGSLLRSGQIGVALGNLNGAIKSLEKINADLSSSASPQELSTSHHFAGLVQSGRNKSELAIENFVKALSFDPSRGDTLQKLAEEYERAKKFKEALNFFTTNKNLGKKNPDVMLGIVRSHIGLEQWISAITQLEDGQKQFPEDARFPSMLGRLYLKRGNFFDAQKPLERAVEIDPTLLDSHAMLAQLAWKMDKDIGKGETHVEKIVSLPEFITAKIAAQVAEYYRMSQRRDIAHEWFRASLKEDPNYWPARIAHARLLLEERRYDEARLLLEKARKEGVSDVRLSAYLADAYRQSKDFDRAIDEINKVIAQFPNNEEYAFILGMIEFDRGNYETARKHFNHAYEINPKFHRAYFYVGRTLFATNQSENALRIFRHVLDNEPNKGEYRFFMARALENAKRTTQALDEYRKATAIDKTYGIENPSVYVYRGKLLSKLGYTVEGKTDIARALTLDPNNATALIAMANVNFNEKDYPSAIKNYTTALKKNPDQSTAQAQLGMSYLYQDKFRKAATHLQLAVKYGYKNPDVYKDLGYLYKDLGQRSLAKKAFKKYLDITKDAKIPSATKREVLEQIRGLK